MRNFGQHIDAVGKQLDAEFVKKMLSTCPKCVRTGALTLRHRAESDRFIEHLIAQRIEPTQIVSALPLSGDLALHARISDRTTRRIGSGEQHENRYIQHQRHQGARAGVARMA
ncbi:MAG: hypothetical protein ABJH07_13660 [Sedimentitalea sp.]|uniref:hypothetical protein n=1 Tax=Sedimentitalea sp. TaxID=2048915 RepID=UPI003264AD54